MVVDPQGSRRMVALLPGLRWYVPVHLHGNDTPIRVGIPGSGTHGNPCTRHVGVRVLFIGESLQRPEDMHGSVLHLIQLGNIWNYHTAPERSIVRDHEGSILS